MTIGYTNPGYPVQRTVLGKCACCTYVRSRSFISLVEKLCEYVNIRPNVGVTYCGGTNLTKIDLMHFFNAIDMQPHHKPYVTTFETTLPRFPKQKGWWWRKGVASMVSPACRRLIALSDCNAAMQRKLFASLGLDEVSCKIKVLHPPQDLLLDSVYSRSSSVYHGYSVPLRFLFVGRDFFRKGGGEIVRVFAKLRREFPIELVCIGDFNRHDYMTCIAKDDSASMGRLIEANRDWLKYYPSLPNAHVLELMKKCDVGLLPTRADTYGYSVLEMQACGLPCITTNVRALPEINSTACGWVISVPKEECGEAFHHNQEEIERLSEMIEIGLEKTVRNIFDEARETIETRGHTAFERIGKYHDPLAYGRALKQIYLEALG